jgi:hypothetical protein
MRRGKADHGFGRFNSGPYRCSGQSPAIVRAGYQLVENFALPPEAWWHHYYSPMKPVLAQMRSAHGGNESVQAVVAAFEREIDMHRRYGDYFGYYFYIIRPNASI